MKLNWKTILVELFRCALAILSGAGGATMMT